MEQVPHVAMYCHEEKDKHHWMHLVPSFLLPLVVRYLTDINNQVSVPACDPSSRPLTRRSRQVRKTAQAALLVLLEQQLVAHNDVEEQVCPLLMMLTNADAHDDFRTEAAAVSSSPCLVRSCLSLAMHGASLLQIEDPDGHFPGMLRRERHG